MGLRKVGTLIVLEFPNHLSSLDNLVNVHDY